MTLRRLVPKNLGWKLGSLLLAILLWIAVSATPDIVTTHMVPVLYQNLPSSLMVTGDGPETLHVELRGPAGQLTTAALADTVALFDLAGVDAAGEKTLTISDANLNLPRGVRFLRAVPSQLRLRLSHLISREVPVEARFSGTLPAGYRIVSQATSPDHLRIAGSEARVNAVTNVETDPIDLGEMMNSREIEVNAFVADPQVRFESPPIVKIKIDIEKTGN